MSEESSAPGTTAGCACLPGTSNESRRNLEYRPCRVCACFARVVDVEIVAGWLAPLDANSLEQVVAALEILREQGPAPGRPLVDAVTASRHRNMKELRPGSSGRSELRILFAFDPTRSAILLPEGNKARDWKRWYTKSIPRADKLFDEHIQNLEGR